MVQALSIVENVMWGILTFSILVVMHEGGHFLAARAFGVKVHEFMIGLPGPALRFHARDMDWGVTAVPLGGYVRIAGMEPGTEDPLVGETLAAVRDHGIAEPRALARLLGVDEDRAEALLFTVEDWKAVRREKDGSVVPTIAGDIAGATPTELADRARSVTYRGQSTPKRIAILAMGVITNLLVAILTLTAFFAIFGYYESTTVISGVGEDSPAQVAGLLDGDEIIAVDGERFETADRFLTIMSRTNPGDTAIISVIREGTALDLPVTLGGRDGHGYLGVNLSGVPRKPGIIESVGMSLSYVRLVFQVIGDLFDPATFSGTVRNFTGPIGVSVMAEQAASGGPLAYASLIAMLSLSLGIMNILPIPPLDGGKIALEIIERVIGRPLSRAVTLGFSAVGTVLLFGLIGIIMYQDIIRYAL
ncbi:MAG: site-2 protease family protein [Coriobacteriia bacterium]|nr:site-2 protease family protein [Coriobacteriia bacterium]